MTKTVCDICGREMPIKHIHQFRDYNFCISSYGRIWDVCKECREELNEWINKRKKESEDKEEVSE